MRFQLLTELDDHTNITVAFVYHQQSVLFPISAWNSFIQKSFLTGGDAAVAAGGGGGGVVFCEEDAANGHGCEN